MLYDYPIKLLYIVFLFAPLAFTSFGSKMTIVTALLITPFILSNWLGYYTIGGHWPLYVITPIFLAAIDSLSKRTERDIKATIRVIMISSLIFIVSVSPLSPLSLPFIEQNILWYPKLKPMNEDVKMIHEMLRLIPGNESVLTQNNLFPHVSSRINAYVIPIGDYPPNATEFLKNYVKDLINKVNFILIDLRQRGYWSRFTLNEIKNSSSFRIYALAKKAVIFKKNYEGLPKIMPNLNELTFTANKDFCLLYTSPSPRDISGTRMPSSA